MGKKISIKEASEILGAHTVTLKRWEKEGRLIPSHRTPGNHRRYDLDEVLAFAELEPMNILNSKEKVYIYSRVSTKKQADSGNLERQTSRLTEFCNQNGYEVVDIFEEVASGLNDNRRQLHKMLKNLDKVSKIIVEYPDRLARFGLKYIELHCSANDVQILFVEENDNVSSEEEMVKDLVSIITSFSARLYGSRGGRKITDNFKKSLATASKED